MEYKVIRKEFGGQPLAGYMMNVIDLTRDKDGLDAIAFLKMIDEFTTMIFDISEEHNNDLREFFFALNTSEDVFALDFCVKHSFEELKTFKGDYENTHYYRMYTQDEDWGLDEIEIEKENKDMDKTTAQNIINIIREFDNLYKNGEISNSDNAEEMIIEFATSETLYTTDFIRDKLKKKFPLEEKYDLVEVTVNRVRNVLEKATIKVAVAKSFSDNAINEAELYISNGFTGESSLYWEVEDEEYEYEDMVIEESEIVDTDTLDELESCNDIDATLD